MDADACPVKDEATRLAHDYKVQIIFVASYQHRMHSPTKGKWIYVDDEKESADLYILNHIKAKDILISQDIGLAGLALPKGVLVLSPKGMQYREETIETALDFRYLAAKERRRGRYGKGPKPFLEEDRVRFIELLSSMLSK
ncbi:YaiI/YqxD family protein [Bacillus sp. 2205SS5-2]|uniref:YaiI/YqxD family protein n=1 Tax=Bacillus sp. 2205SS5-2 TaxID=3109031 RepID=UPI003FA53B76